MKNLAIFLAIIIVNLTYSQEITTQDSTSASKEVAFDSIEKVPVFPGCDKNMGNQALKECFNERMKSHISKNFNSNIGKNLDLLDGSIQKINVFFKINKNGEVSDVVIKSNEPKLDAEAQRIIDLLPKFEPGYIEGEAVRVPYYLPIKFKVNNPKNNTEKTFPLYRSCDPTLHYEALKECTTQKIMDYIKVSVNYELADKLFPLDKSTQFHVSFTINKKGKLENITAKAHKREMAAEAINVLKRMPKLKKPGYLSGKPVDTEMSFLMTIYF